VGSDPGANSDESPATSFSLPDRIVVVVKLVGRIFRRIATVLMTLMVVAILAAWWRGRSHAENFSVGRDCLDDTAWRQIVCRFDWAGGDVGMICYHSHAEARHALAKGFAPGTRWATEWWSREDADSYPTRLKYPDWFREGRVNSKFRRRAGIVTSRQQGWGSMYALGRRNGIDSYVYTTSYYLAVPCWMPALLFSLIPAKRTFAYFHRRRRLAHPGRCPSCGYDLRATPNADGPLLPHCPECGQETRTQLLCCDPRGVRRVFGGAV
jgi:hypothetical protein